MISFASDNNGGVHPAVMRALLEANQGQCPAYGADALSAEAEALFREVFGPETRAYFVFSGTAANALILEALLKPYEAVICAESAHIHTDECGALEARGRKLLTAPGRDGKLNPEACLALLAGLGDAHHIQPRMLSLTQPTELGAVYAPEEIRALADFCRARNLLLHMDGARLSNAAAALGLGLREAGLDLGVDALSLGGAKNGLMYGEAALFFRPGLAEDFAFYRKRGMQLGAKLRYVAAQFIPYLRAGLWLECARQANAMTRLLADLLQDTPGLQFSRPAQANALFARLPRKAVEKLRENYAFYIWDENPAECRELGCQELRCQEVRWMTGFDTTPGMVREFAGAVQAALR